MPLSFQKLNACKSLKFFALSSECVSVGGGGKGLNPALTIFYVLYITLYQNHQKVKVFVT